MFALLLHRILITLMGNALGLVRSLQTAQSVYSAQIVNFVPDPEPEQLPEFANLVAATATFKVRYDGGEKFFVTGAIIIKGFYVETSPRWIQLDQNIL